MATRKLTRRQVTRTALASSALVSAPFVRGVHAAGKLSIGFWDHWVPGANAVTKALTEEWAAKEKVEVQIDFITSQGNKLLLTAAAEAQAKTGHDIMAMSTWRPNQYAEVLEPVDDIMAPLIQQNGAVNTTVAYLGRAGGKWVAVPSTVGGQIKGPCTRIDLLKQHAGIDIRELYPVGAAPKADGWTYDTYLKAAEACHKAKVPFGIGISTATDSVDTAGAFFQGFGAELVDAKGNITVKSDAVRQALDFYKRLVPLMPEGIATWDDASNNKELISGRSTSIMNPPSAWAVAKRDAPAVAEQLWTHGMPAGPKGRYAPFLAFFWGIWSFSKNKPAAKSLLTYLSQPDAAERLVNASGGFDLPAFANLTSFKIWAEAGPPPGTLYHYANPHNHQILSIAGAPAPPKIAVQIYVNGVMPTMAARYVRGEPVEQVLDWATRELESFSRS